MGPALLQLEPRHQCMIYDGSPSLQLPMFALIIRNKLREGYRCLYLNSPTMVAGLRCCLAEIGVDVASEVAENHLVLSSDSPTTSNGSFDIDAMLDLLTDAVHQAIDDGFKGLWGSGDMAWEFGAERDFSKLLEYEFRLEEIFRSTDKLHGICQYHRDSLPSDAIREGMLSHENVFINETLSRSNPYYLRTGRLEDCPITQVQLDEIIRAKFSAVPA